MIRRFGDTPVAGARYQHRPGVYAILPREGLVLLTFQSGTQPELQLPGGGIDPGESPIQALHREVYEETGWRITAPRRIGAFRRYAYMPEYRLSAEKLCTVYLARPVAQLGPPVEDDHLAIWSRPDKAMRELGNPGDRHFMGRFVIGV